MVLRLPCDSQNGSERPRSENFQCQSTKMHKTEVLRETVISYSRVYCGHYLYYRNICSWSDSATSSCFSLQHFIYFGLDKNSTIYHSRCVLLKTCLIRTQYTSHLTIVFMKARSWCLK